MSSMALYRHLHPRHVPLHGSSKAPLSVRQGFLGRVRAAFERRRQGRIELEAGRFIATHGGRVTDDVERQLTAHFSDRGFPRYAPPRSFRPFRLGS
jgi:hypothetical protein